MYHESRIQHDNENAVKNATKNSCLRKERKNECTQNTKRQKNDGKEISYLIQRFSVNFVEDIEQPEEQRQSQNCETIPKGLSCAETNR